MPLAEQQWFFLYSSISEFTDTVEMDQYRLHRTPWLTAIYWVLYSFFYLWYRLNIKITTILSLMVKNSLNVKLPRQHEGTFIQKVQLADFMLMQNFDHCAVLFIAIELLSVHLKHRDRSIHIERACQLCEYYDLYDLKPRRR